LEQVDRNVNPTTLVESWLDGVAEMAMPLRPARHAP
jgi:hypothetical protein